MVPIIDSDIRFTKIFTIKLTNEKLKMKGDFNNLIFKKNPNAPPVQRNNAHQLKVRNNYQFYFSANK